MALGSTPFLYNPPNDEGTWLTWGAVHQSDHFSLATATTALVNAVVPILPIDPVLLPPRFPGSLTLGWLVNHQAIHDALSAALGIGNFDLSFVNFGDKESVAVWIQYNAYIHQATAAAIGQLQAAKVSQQTQQALSQPVQPQGVNQINPQGNRAILPQGNPGITTILSQPRAGTQIAPQGSLPQAPLQPFATLQPQTAPMPANLQPGTPLLPGNPGVT